MIENIDDYKNLFARLYLIIINIHGKMVSTISKDRQISIKSLQTSLEKTFIAYTNLERLHKN